MKIGSVPRLLLLSLCLSGCGQLPAPGTLTPVPDAEAVGVFHQVHKGETLSSICKAYKTDLQEVAEMNGIENSDSIQVGQKIFIPDVKKSLRPGQIGQGDYQEMEGAVYLAGREGCPDFKVRNTRRTAP